MSFRIKIQFLTYRYAIINMLYFISMMLCIFTFSIFQTSSSLNGFGTQLITLQSVEVALTPVMVKVPYIYHRGDSPQNAPQIKMHPNQNAWAESQGSDSDNIWQISEDQYFKVDPRTDFGHQPTHFYGYKRVQYILLMSPNIYHFGNVLELVIELD